MRDFFDLVESGRVAVAASALADLPADVLSVLRRTRIVRDGEAGAAELSPRELLAALRRVYGVASHGVALPSVLDARPVLLGWTGKGADEREVVLVARPSVGLAPSLARPYRCLVLVPTARELTVTRRRRHGPGAFLEVEALEEALSVVKGSLVRRDAGARPSRGEARASHGDWKGRLGGAKRWNQVRICFIEDALLRVDLPDRSVRCAPADFGMVDSRSRKPTVIWEALVTLCQDSGTFKTTRFGSPRATKKVISRLRIRLRDVFALKAPPFRRYQGGMGWRAHFVARPNLPGEVDDGARSMREWVKLGDKSLRHLL